MLTKLIEADRHAHSQIASFLVAEGYSYSYDQEYFKIEVNAEDDSALENFETFLVAFAASCVEDKKPWSGIIN